MILKKSWKVEGNNNNNTMNINNNNNNRGLDSRPGGIALWKRCEQNLKEKCTLLRYLVAALLLPLIAFLAK